MKIIIKLYEEKHKLYITLEIYFKILSNPLIFFFFFSISSIRLIIFLHFLPLTWKVINIL